MHRKTLKVLCKSMSILPLATSIGVRDMSRHALRTAELSLQNSPCNTAWSLMKEMFLAMSVFFIGIVQVEEKCVFGFLREC